MSSLVPSFSLSRLRPIFGLSWHWINRPSYQIKVRHQFEIGGFEVKDGPSIELDPMGLEWMRIFAPLREAIRAIDRSLLGIGLMRRPASPYGKE